MLAVKDECEDALAACGGLRSLTAARAVILGLRAIPPKTPETSMNSSLFHRIEAYPVSEHARLGTLPRHFGRYMIVVEGRIYDLMRQFAGTYSGGCWHFFELSNGGFYMSPPDEAYEIHIDSNGFKQRMSADAAGITICLFTFSGLSFEYTADVFTRHYHWLRDFAWSHPEARLIFEAID